MPSIRGSRDVNCGPLLISPCGPLRRLPGLRFLRSTFRAGRVRRCPAGAQDGAVSAALRLPCAARLEGVPHNSLRSLRSLRSNRMRQVSSRSSLRSPPSRLRCSAPHTAPPPGPACRSGTGGGVRRGPPLLPAKGCPGGARRACEAPRSAGFMARERSEPRKHFWRILFERSERSERSELCAGPWTRAPQGSRSAAKAASVARRAPPGQAFAATMVRMPRPAQPNVRNGPIAAALPLRCMNRRSRHACRSH